MTGTPVLLAASAVVALGTLMLFAAWLFARWYATPTRRPLRQTPAAFGLPFTPVSFPSGSTRLDGWMLGRPADDGFDGPTVVVAHGWSGNRARMLPPAAALYGAGFTVLLFDARGHGTSGGDGPMTILKFAHDILAAAEFLRTAVGVDPRRIGVLGHSMGGSSALLAAALDDRIGAVVSSSAFADPVALTARFLRALHLPRGPFLWAVCRVIEGWLGRAMEDVTPRLRIHEIRAPVLLLHGADDRFIPASEVEVLYGASVRSRAERVLLGDRGHSDVLTDHRYAGHVVSFFARHLAGPSVADEGRPTGAAAGP